MSELQPVSFRKPREHKPRLSPPRVPGRHSKRFWKDDEKEVVKAYYPSGGVHACLAHLGPHRTPSGVYRQATQLGLTTPQGLADYKGVNGKIVAPPGFDDALRAFYRDGDGRKRGECNAFADRWKMPRWWVTKRAIALELAMPHKKEPPWTEPELALLKRTPLHDLDKAAAVFRQHGFPRSPSALANKAKRIAVSRRYREALSATAASKILGVDAKNFSLKCIAGDVKASRRPTKRLPQQGGDWWAIKPQDLRQYILDNLSQIDLRKVDKFAFVQLIAAQPLEPEAPRVRQPPAPTAVPRTRRVPAGLRGFARQIDSELRMVARRVTG